MKEVHLTIKEIAKEAHVGIGTVSRVLNNSPNISEKTKGKVLSVIRAYDFQPNSMASHLAMKASCQSYIGFVTHDFLSRYTYDLLEEVYQMLQQKQIHLIFMDYQKEKESFLPQFADIPVSGLLFLSVLPETSDIKLLSQKNIPMVFLSCMAEGYPSIQSDKYLGGKLAADYLLDKNCSSLLYICEAKGINGLTSQEKGFRDELKAKGQCRCYSCSFSMRQADRFLILDWFVEKHGITGISCCNDELAIDILRHLRAIGSTVRIIGFNGINDTKAWNLSTISQNPAQMGNSAARMMVDLLGHKATVQRTVMVAPTLIDRNS
ncbi:MAG: LacI family transcriptional regulator [Spirochaetia bacterium]|jgi:LacI family transcriptional regulator|nr:LacI family transcriptional regulator [Spirochaetia bacterium]